MFPVFAVACLAGFIALASAGSIPTIEIAKDVHMPMMVLGGENCSFPDIAAYGSCSNYSLWLDLGGRGFDTAWEYQTSLGIREAFHKSGLPRSEVFVVTKIPGSLSFNCTDPKCSHYPSPMPVSGHYTPEMARHFIAKDLEMLGFEIGYIDLLLLHEPCNFGGWPHNYTECAAIYAVLEDALRDGIVRSIGVDQFGVDDLEQLKKVWKVKPAVNMMPMTLGEFDQAAWDWCKREGIAAFSISALHSPCLHNELVQSVATAHNVSVYQVALRWLVQNNVPFVTASNKSSHLTSDMAIFDYILTDSEMSALTVLTCKKDQIIV